ncbi:hypothetical protein H0H81_000518 [Sphagnurus paluster]|uniref:Uncharacterized protein n=1 Tax=Sphagnurus paluster TaxID=117069 RepID=A0A9P7GNE1_9AGAR|nr:hypothetical protein H0H81_000518 [Sphagnurus paluster]
MLPIFYGIANKIHTSIGKQVADGPQEIDILRWMTRAALEMIGQSGLGYSFDSLEDNQSESAYTKFVKELLSTAFTLKFAIEFLLTTAVKIGTPSFRRACIRLFPNKNLHKLRDTVDLMERTSVEIMEGKKRALEKGDEALKEQVSQGKDIISILSKPCLAPALSPTNPLFSVKANLEASEHDRLDDEEVIG